jgi:hypothetical protein
VLMTSRSSRAPSQPTSPSSSPRNSSSSSTSRRQGTRADDPAVAAAAGGSDHPVAVLDQRGQLLRAAVGFAGCSMPSSDRALHALRTWLDSWTGIGHVAVGMARQGYDLQLTRYDEKG